MSNAKDDNDVLKEHGRENLDPMADLVPLYPKGISEHLETLKACQLARFYDDATQQMLNRALGKERPLRLPWPAANAALGGGLWPGLHVLVGNTGSGKSQLALQAALYAANGRNNYNGNNVPVLYLGLELGHTDLVARLLGLQAGMRWSDLYLGKSEQRLSEAMEAGAHIQNCPFFLDVSPPMGWDYATLYDRVKALRYLFPEGPLLIVMDYLQLVAGEGRDLRERIGRASYQARAAARDFDATVLVLSSTARENYASLCDEKLGDGPTIQFVGLGKEAGEIEYAADSVMALASKPPSDSDEAPASRTVYLAIAKVRAGRPGWVELRFDGCRFRDPTEQPGVSW